MESRDLNAIGAKSRDILLWLVVLPRQVVAHSVQVIYIPSEKLLAERL